MPCAQELVVVGRAGTVGVHHRRVLPKHGAVSESPSPLTGRISKAGSTFIPSDTAEEDQCKNQMDS